MPASNKWKSAGTEQKIEMLREDIALISDAHNALGRQFRQVQALVASLGDDLEKIKRKLDKK
jgi:hypothetical protein